MTYSADPSSTGPKGWDQSTNNQSANGASGPGNWGSSARCRGMGRWHPLELAAMILGFMVFWPLGLAVVAFKVWQSRSGYGGDLFTFAGDRAETAARSARNFRDQFNGRGAAGGMGGGWGFRSTGTAAFDDWRAGELSRLEEERRKLEAAERAFSDHIGNLRRARDREEFDRFMRERANSGPANPAP